MAGTLTIARHVIPSTLKAPGITDDLSSVVIEAIVDCAPPIFDNVIAPTLWTSDRYGGMVGVHLILLDTQRAGVTNQMIS